MTFNTPKKTRLRRGIGLRLDLVEAAYRLTAIYQAPLQGSRGPICSKGKGEGNGGREQKEREKEGKKLKIKKKVMEENIGE